MKSTAAGLAALGRGPDSMLVHMSPREVAGLQALAKSQGTSLTINPHTGLPEAFSLESLLPTIAGAGLMMIPGMQPLAAGLIVGAGHGLLTGFKNPLQSVMAGVGGAGGAGLGGALSSAGTAASAAAPAAAAGDTAATLGPDLTGSFAHPDVPAQTMGGAGTMAQFPQTPQQIAAANYAAGDVGAFSRAPVTLEGMSKGISGMMSGGAEGESARKAFMGSVDGVSGLAKTGAMAAAPAAAGMMEPEQMGGTKPISTIRPYSFNREVAPGAFDDVTDSRERRYFNDQFIAKEPYQLARGGLAAFARGGKAKKFDPLEQRYEMANFRDPQAMQKKTMGMYQYAVGGKAVSGPGDGMSDDVRANIDGVREARLSDGEFVIPADVVSGLGNGSTDAGAKQLREMMDRVRQKRTGRKQQAPQIKVKGLMPT
jgi:hypothetical protein